MHLIGTVIVGAAGLAALGFAGAGGAPDPRARLPESTDSPNPSASPVSTTSRTSTRVRDRRLLAFREDADPARVVAEIEARVEVCGACPGASRGVTEGDRLVCVVHASAAGPRVDGAPGPLSVHGGNVITAEELSRLFARDGVSVRRRGDGTRGPSADASAVSASITRGQVLGRRVHPDGRVVHEFVGPVDGVVAVTWTSPPLPDGTTTLEVVADGRVRVRCVVRVGDGDGRVLRLVQIDEHGAEGGS